MNWLVDADVAPPIINIGAQATGGEESIINVRGQRYKVHRFVGGATHIFSVTQGGEAEILVVGNGGAGGFIAMEGPEDFPDMAPHRVAMGGGPGGGVVEARVNLTVGNYSIGNLGNNASVFFNGFDQPYVQFDPPAVFFDGPGISLGAISGGRGSLVGYSIPSDSFFLGPTNSGPVGSTRGASSGGGGSVFSSGATTTSFAVEAELRTIVGQGNVGGTEIDPAAPNVDPEYFTNSFSGGGGGASGAGVLGGVSTAPNGGAGYISSITGQPVIYGGGGGGGSLTDVRGIGSGGGGNGATITEPATNGQDGTGGGGGGCASLETGRVNINTMAQRLIGGQGGSGVVIVRYPIGG